MSLYCINDDDSGLIYIVELISAVQVQIKCCLIKDVIVKAKAYIIQVHHSGLLKPWQKNGIPSDL